jgi:hypothetical protein
MSETTIAIAGLLQVLWARRSEVDWLETCPTIPDKIEIPPLGSNEQVHLADVAM